MPLPLNEYKKESWYTGFRDLIKNMDKDILAGVATAMFSLEWLDLNTISPSTLRKVFIRLTEEGLPHNKYITQHNTQVVHDGEHAVNGFNFPFLSPPLIDALITCKEAKQNGQQANFLDIGCGWGTSVWKAMLAGCKVYAVDVGFAEPTFAQGFATNVKSMVPTNMYTTNLVVISKSIFNLLTEHPEYYQQFDLIYSSRVLHFQAPKHFNSFAQAAYDLAKPSAKAYVIVDSVHALKQLGKGCNKAYEHNKINHLSAPGYLCLTNIVRDTSTSHIVKSGGCHNKCRDDIDNWDKLPSYSEEYDLVRTFDTETLKTIFEQVGFTSKDSYYLNVSSGDSISFSRAKNGDAGAVIELEKPYSCDTSNPAESDLSSHEQTADGW